MSLDTILAVQTRIKTGQTTAVEETKRALASAKQQAELNMFISLHEDQALATAADIDKRIAAGEPVGRLAGVPFAVKDNFLYDHGVTTAGSSMLKGYKAPYTATSLQKILNEDAVLIGKTNLDAFAHGTSTENSDFGPTKNPVDPSKVPGGSSGGSAAVVAAGVVPFSLGSDTGGSIRLPSSFCGVVGLKPTYGMISRYGVVAMASSTDCIGPIANTSSDIALLTDILKGQDKHDATTIDSSLSDVDIDLKTPLKIGLIKEFEGEGVDPKVGASYSAAVDKLKTLGHEITEVTIPSITKALACYYVIVPAEVSSNLGRYDGLRYGHRSADAKTLEESYLKNRAQGFGSENKRRIMIGTYVLSSGYYDAYYKKAQQLRTKLIKEFETALEQVDVLVSLVAPFTAFELGGKIEDPVSMYKADIMTVSANLVGVPAISVPISTANDMPVGLQIMGRQQADGLVIALSKQIEGAK